MVQREHAQDPKDYPNSGWFTGNNLELAFGQGGTVITPIEQAVAYATFANGGTRYVPEIAAGLVDAHGKVGKTFAPKVAGHIRLLARRLPGHPLGVRGSGAELQGHRQRRLHRLPAVHVPPGGQDGDGHDQRAAAQLVVRGLGAGPEPQVPDRGGGPGRWLRLPGGGPRGAPGIRLPGGAPRVRRPPDVAPPTTPASTTTVTAPTPPDTAGAGNGGHRSRPDDDDHPSPPRGPSPRNGAGVDGEGSRLGGHMTSLWPRIEPLLAQVTKPARYIGGELGACRPVHARDRVAWLLLYPDTYEIGLPNQGLQILYEILNERADAVAERAYAPWTDMEAAMRAASVPLFSLESSLAAGEFDVLAFNLSAELTYTNVLNLVDLAGVPVRGAERDESHPLVVAGGHCAFNPEPLADFVDAFVLGDGEEAVGELTEAIGSWRASVAKVATTCCAAWRRCPGCTSPRATSRSYEGGPPDRRVALGAGRPRARGEADHRRPGGVALSQAAARPPDRGRPRPSQRRGVPGVHTGVPVLPGGDDHPARARTARRPGRRDGTSRPRPHRLRRGHLDVTVERGLLGHR